MQGLLTHRFLCIVCVSLFPILNAGNIVITPNHVYAGVNKIDLAKDTVYTHPSIRQCTIPIASSTQDGLMSSEMVTMLSSITEVASIFTGSYVGDGETNGNVRLEFPSAPKILFFFGEGF